VEAYVQLAREFQPELIVLGMGMPKQEAVAARLAASGVPCLIVCGGAILDFLGGKVSRAPSGCAASVVSGCSG
jgi:UDP-N-acetyl-D-mannosaminuronic acid transferase (WecB/TagA/CpsF family)